MSTLHLVPAPEEPSAEDLRLLIESVQDYAIFMLDPHGRVLTWNGGAERIKGYQAAEIVGQHFSRFYPADELAAGTPARELELALSMGRLETEGWRLRKDGSRFWAHAVITALHDGDGSLRGFSKVTRDLTLRQVSEEALRRSEERFRLLVEAVDDYAIYMLDPDGRVTTWNAGAEKIKGYRPEEVLGRSFGLFFPETAVRAGEPQRELEAARTAGRFEGEGLRVRKDGSTFWAGVVITPIRDGRGELLGFAKVTRDLSARIEAEQNARKLAVEQAARAAAEEGERQLQESELRYRALSRRLEAIFDGIADGIGVQEAPGRLIFANMAAARGAGFASVEEFIGASNEQLLSRIEILDEDGAPFDLELLPGRRVLRGEPACSALIRVRFRETQEERWRLVRATGLVGAEGLPELAISIWHDVTESQRRASHDRYLAQATVALSASLDYSSMLSTLAALLVPGLADWCTIHLFEGDQLCPVAVSHVDENKVKLAREVGKRYPPSPEQPRGIWNVLRTGSSELHNDIPDALLTRVAHDAEHLEILRAVGMKSVIIVPIRLRDRVLGTISLISAEGGRRYDGADLAMAEELGRRAASAIENSRLYAAERKARDQLSLLAHAGESFAAATGYEEMLRSVVEIVLPALGDFAFFDVVEGPDVRRIAAAHEDPELDALIRDTKWVRSERDDNNICALSSGRSGFEPQIDDAWMERVATGPEQLALLRKLALGSLVTVPLRSRRKVLGSLTVCFGKSGRHHSADDLKLVEELARRATTALVQARLYTRAQESARNAEEANRVKDEFLATVSHELRTPLNAILGWSSVLRARPMDPAVEKAIETIHRNALAQGKIIEDILDVSRIITGKLRLDPKATDLVALVADAIEVIRPSANAKRISLEFSHPDRPCRLLADPDRLQQVAWNLLSNAVKFSDPGAAIRVSIEREATTLLLSVSDNGSGIDSSFLPFVFDRFKQADSSTTRRVGGLGLGLAIVRHLVELHGGQVEARSPGLGQGATFRVTLPLAEDAPDEDGGAEQVASAPPPRLAPERRLDGTRVLLVDDELDARELVEEILREAGAVVATAASAAEGFTLLQRLKPQVLISDIGMPEEDGYSFMQRIKALAPSAGGAIPSIALTAYTRRQDKAKALAMGFTTHVAKPVDAAELVAAVENLAALLRR